jgi:hypothetical protein
MITGGRRRVEAEGSEAMALLVTSCSRCHNPWRVRIDWATESEREMEAEADAAAASYGSRAT